MPFVAAKKSLNYRNAELVIVTLVHHPIPCSWVLQRMRQRRKSKQNEEKSLRTTSEGNLMQTIKQSPPLAQVRTNNSMQVIESLWALLRPSPIRQRRRIILQGIVMDLEVLLIKTSRMMNSQLHRWSETLRNSNTSRQSHYPVTHHIQPY